MRINNSGALGGKRMNELMNKENQISFWDIPEDTQKLFTTDEVGKILNVKPSNISSMVYRYGIKKIIKTTNKGRTYYFDYKAMREIKAYFDRRNKEREAKGLQRLEAEPTEKYSIEELKKLHPLVTDERCFLMSYWPETLPKCFEDLEV